MALFEAGPDPGDLAVPGDALEQLLHLVGRVRLELRREAGLAKGGEGDPLDRRIAPGSSPLFHASTSSVSEAATARAGCSTSGRCTAPGKRNSWPSQKVRQASPRELRHRQAVVRRALLAFAVQRADVPVLIVEQLRQRARPACRSCRTLPAQMRISSRGTRMWPAAKPSVRK